MRLPAPARSAPRLLLLAALAPLAGCFLHPPAKPPKPPRDGVESLWDLAPHEASGGVVTREGSSARILELIAKLQQGPARTELDKAAKKWSVEPLPSLVGWTAGGLDLSLGAAAFSWPDKKRGLLLVLPVKDRVAFRQAFHFTSRMIGEREVDEVGQGYLCAPAVGRYLCARAIEDLDAAAAFHGNPLAPAVEKLSPDDRGDIEFYSSARSPDVIKLAQQLEPFGKVTAVAGAIKLRADGASGRIHVIGEMNTPLARSYAGAPPPAGLAPTAAGAMTVVRMHIDPVDAIPPKTVVDPLLRSELIEQLVGDLEMTTSGHGIAGLYAEAPVKDPARVLAFVKKLCADQNGSKRRWALDQITVRDRGCSGVFDPSMLLLPITMKPLELSAQVIDKRLVVTVGDAVPPSPQDRTLAVVAKDTDATWALTDAEAFVAFSRGSWIGPETGAGAAFKAMISLLDEQSMARVDAFNDLVSRIAQTMLAARVAEDGVVISGDFVTFDRDPPDARAAYDAALALRVAGDVHAYHARLADIEKRFPGTLAAQRAAQVRAAGPFLGAGTVFFSGLGQPPRKAK